MLTKEGNQELESNSKREINLLRVIAGLAKGKRLKAPSGLNTRPITDMIKEALFNVWGQGIGGSCLLDLFAGSGSVGIEALSRGAQQVVFIDHDAKAIKVLKENLENCGFAEKSVIYRNDVFRAVEILNRNKAEFDYIYVDPPFTNDKIFDEIITFLDEVDLLTPEGILVIRTRRNRKMPGQLQNISSYRTNSYGESNLNYYRKSKEGPIL